MLRTLEGHGKQRAGICYNIVKKAETTNNHRTMEAKLGIGKALKTTRISPETQEVLMTITLTIA